MVKYIIKRILISILILFGVSVIIYTMVRLMPNDYIDHKYEAQLNQGTLKQDDIDNFKALYGLYTPEARLHLTVDGEDGTFDRDVRKVIFDEILSISQEVDDYDVTADGVGLYRNKTSRTEESIGDGLMRVTEKRMELTVNRDDATLYEYHYYTSVFEDRKEIMSVEDNFGNVTEQEKIVTKETKNTISRGTYKFTCDDGEFTFVFSKVSGSGSAPAVSGITYVKTTFGERLGTILSGYFTWLGNLIKGDLGVSFKYEKPVGQVISENMWVSFAIEVKATIRRDAPVFGARLHSNNIYNDRHFSAYVLLCGNSYQTVCRRPRLAAVSRTYQSRRSLSRNFRRIFQAFRRHVCSPYFADIRQRNTVARRTNALYAYQHVGSTVRRLYQNGARQGLVGKDGNIQARV